MYSPGAPHLRGMDQAQAHYYSWLPAEVQMQMYDMSMMPMEYYSYPQQQQLQQLQQQQQQQQQQQAAMMQAPHPGHIRAAAAGTGPQPMMLPVRPPTMEEVCALVQDLKNVDKREQALAELSRLRETMPDLAPILWHSYGTMVALIQEMVCVYPQLCPPPTLSAAASNRVCNSLTLLQSVASHPETRPLLLKANIPLLLYPFLNTVSKDRAFEYLRLTSLGVICALVKDDDAEVIKFLLHMEILPLCLRIMETGNELAKTVSTVIVQKLLLDDLGLTFICQTPERFQAVSSCLSKMSIADEKPSMRLLKHVVRCYLRLSENSRAREALRAQIQSDGAGGHAFLVGALKQCFPDSVGADPTVQHLPEAITEIFREDVTTRRWLQQLLINLRESALEQQPVPVAARVAGWQQQHTAHQIHAARMQHAGFG